MDNIKYFAESFVGRRSNNQDSCCTEIIDDNFLFTAVADGMGGVAGGQVASNLVLEHCISFLKENLPKNNDESFKKIFNEMFITSQRKLAERIKDEPDLAGMGTTLTALLIWDKKFIFGNIGDSRIYQLKNNNLTQITEDHTFINDYKKEHPGNIPQYIIDQYSHYLLKSVDGGADAPDIFPKDKLYEDLDEDTMFMLCSDGLITDKTEDNTTIIKKYICGRDSLKEIAQNLISYAYYNKSTDNITSIIIEYGNCKRDKIKMNKLSYPPTNNSLLAFWELNYFSIIVTLFTLLVLYILILV